MVAGSGRGRVSNRLCSAYSPTCGWTSQPWDHDLGPNRESDPLGPSSNWPDSALAPPPQFWTQQSVTRGPHGSDHDAYLCRALFTRHLEYNLNSLPHLARLYTILYCLPGNFKATPTLLSSVPALWVFLSSLKSHSSSLPQDFGCSIP